MSRPASLVARRAVYVRGAGVVSVTGACAARAIDFIDAPAGTPAPSRSGPARHAPFQPADLPGGVGRRLGRQPALALAAVLDALGARRPDGDTALVLSTAHGAMSESIDFLRGAAAHGAVAASPLLFSNSLHNAMAGAVGRTLNVRGPALVISNGPVSFESALVSTVALLRSGRARSVIVGGSDASHPLVERGLRAVGLLAGPDASADPATGLTDGGYPAAEGGGALVLECGEPGMPGVRIDDAALGASCRLPEGALGSVQWLATGARRSVERHRAAWQFLGVGRVDVGPRPSLPAALHGVFGSLSAVAVAVECARRLSTAVPPTGPSVLLQVPDHTPPACVVVAGHGVA